jgi:hypothetical protein
LCVSTLSALDLATADYEKVNVCTFEELPVTYIESEWLETNLSYWGKLGSWDTSTYDTLETCPYTENDF